MRILDRYIYKEMAVPVIFGISMFTFIMLIDVLSEMMESVLVKKIPLLEVLELMSYYLPPLMVLTIPMGVLLGIMLAFGNLSSNSEVIAMESLGLGLHRFLVPPLIFGSVISLMLLFFQEKLVPNSMQRLEIATKRIAAKKPSLKIEEKVFIEDVGDYNIYINEIDETGDEASNLIIFNKPDDKLYPEIIFAKKTVWKNSNMVFQDAKFYSVNNSGEKDVEGSFEERAIPINSFFSVGKRKRKSLEAMSISQLKKNIVERKERKEETINYEIEYYQKLALPPLAIIFSFLGVMLAMGNRRSGKGVSFGISLVIIFLYVMGITFGKGLAKDGVLSPMVAMWYPAITIFLISLILFVIKLRRR